MFSAVWSWQWTKKAVLDVFDKSDFSKEIIGFRLICNSLIIFKKRDASVAFSTNSVKVNAPPVLKKINICMRIFISMCVIYLITALHENVLAVGSWQ